MANASEIADLITAGIKPPQGTEDVSWHTGKVLSWDETSGVNTVEVQGTILANLSVIQSGLGQTYSPGDVVTIVRKGRLYFVLGRVVPVSKSGSQGIRAQSVAAYHNVSSPVFPAWGDLPTFGPTVTANIGASCRCLVLYTARVFANTSYGMITFDVRAPGGPAIINAGQYGGMVSSLFSQTFNGGPATSVTVGSTVTGQSLLTAAHGLKPGTWQFTMKYAVELSAGGTGAEFDQRTISVIPF